MPKLRMETRKAGRGERMVEVRVRFFTDEIADGKGEIKPKNAWGCGMVRLGKNETHGIKPRGTIPFNSLAELPAVIEKALIRNGITIHPSGKMRKYLLLDGV